MKAGDTVMIYEDPMTQKKPEGKAVLVGKIAETQVMERWNVKFESDEDQITYARWIAK